MPDCTNASVVTIGTVNAMTGQTIHYTYDPLDRLTAADYTDGRYFHYSYDAVGNRLGQESKSDPGGNPATNSYTYDTANRLASVNNTNYSWDNNGNLLSDGTSSYEYDPFNRLSKVVTGGDTYEFQYDPQGNRVGQAMNGAWTYYDLDLNAGLTQVLTAQDEDYLYGLGPTPLAQIDPGDIDYLFKDGSGSVRQLVRGDSYGQVTLTESYDPFGNLLSSLGTGASAFGFAGQWQDDSGLMNMRARYYEPYDGRFITEDSWTGDPNQPMSYNSWLYVNLNPINFIDPTGYFLDPSEPTWRGTIIHLMIEAQYTATYGSGGNVKSNASIINGSTKWLRDLIRKGNNPIYNPNDAENYATGFADIVDYGEMGLYEIKPQNALSLGLATVTWYVTAYNLNNPIPLSPGVRYPGTPGVIVGSDPNNASNWIIGEEYFSGSPSGVILYHSESKNNGRPVPVYVFEWDTKMQKVERKIPAIDPLPFLQPSYQPICEFGVLAFIQTVITNSPPWIESLWQAVQPIIP